MRCSGWSGRVQKDSIAPKLRVAPGMMETGDEAIVK
jgi:hypothetical protein